MGIYLDLFNKAVQDQQVCIDGVTKHETHELYESPLPSTDADACDDYRMHLLQSKKLWQGLCLEYAEALGWPRLGLDSYRSVVSGAHGWHIYLNRASVVELKNHVAPTLKDLIKELT